MNVCILTIRENIDELEELLKTLDHRIVRIFHQKRTYPDTRFYLGKGKKDEIREYVLEEKPDLVVVNDEIRPKQRFNLEKEIGIDVHDRLRIILDIFNKRAQTEEAKLQVELASLQYEMPWIKEIIHRTRTGEHPGLLGGGEYQTRQFYTWTRKRIRLIKQRLKGMEKDRELKRNKRHDRGFILTSISGYTNAGKSTLFNSLTNEQVEVDNRMFATLSTTTRRLGSGQPRIVVTDTVGFIEDLPPWMIEAFNSTLEEVFTSDIVILVVDISDGRERVLSRMKTCLEMIYSGLREQVVIIALNKIDLVEEELLAKNRMQVMEQYPSLDIVNISACNGHGLDDLVLHVQDAAAGLMETVNFTLISRHNSIPGNFVNWMYNNCIVEEITPDDFTRVYNVRVPIRLESRFNGMIRREWVKSNGKNEC